jgi:hypothetical protein
MILAKQVAKVREGQLARLARGKQAALPQRVRFDQGQKRRQGRVA